LRRQSKPGTINIGEHPACSIKKKPEGPRRNHRLRRIVPRGLLTLALLSLCAPSPAHCQPTYQANLAAASNRIASQQLPDGAILTDSTSIDPYFANYAAIGWLSDTRVNRIPAVEAWIKWYIAHLNWPDSEGLRGTVYNYSYDPATHVETSTGAYDSADANAATFLQLADALWNTNDPSAQALIKTTIGEYNLNLTGNVITGLQQPNGLVNAAPNYKVEYLMDNAEDWAGLQAFAHLASRVWNDTTAQNWYQAHASGIQSAIQSVLYIPATRLYYPYAGSTAPDMATFYPDAVAQLWPGLEGVVTPAQAKISYANFLNAWPGWTGLSFATESSPYPWCAISYAAYLAGDTPSINKYIATLHAKRVQLDPGEAGWFMRTNAALAALH